MWDHPRACGYNQASLRTLLQGLGSPPRLRVQLEYCLKSLILNGITPALAGTTLNDPYSDANPLAPFPAFTSLST